MENDVWFRIAPKQKWHYAGSRYYAWCGVGHCGEAEWEDNPPLEERCKTCVKMLEASCSLL